jgi:hypothetical protein
VAELTEPDLRCPNCGASVYAGAEWCTLCFAPIPREEGGTEPAPEPSRGPAVPARDEAASPGGGTPETSAVDAAEPPAGVVEAEGDGGAFWPCPVCEARNPIDLDACATCGTPFASAMRRDREAPVVDPSVAFGRSLLFPGLGHARLGLAAEGFARGILFLILLVVTLLVAVAGASSPLLKVLLITFATGTLGVYLLTALEARRIAEGGGPMVSTRLLLWVTVGVLMASIALIVVVIGTTPTR